MPAVLLRRRICAAWLCGLAAGLPAQAQSPAAGTATATAMTAAGDLPQGHALRALPLADAVARRQGTGRRHVAVFADPYCPYCRQLEADLHKLPDVTIHTFIIPVLRAESASKSLSLWCAPDAGAAWQAWMLHNRAAPDALAGCDHGALARNIALAQRLGVRGTPALVFGDGRIVVGGMAPEALARMLDATPDSRR
jgi:thiol:disulfide interchange protein DsbC